MDLLFLAIKIDFAIRIWVEKSEKGEFFFVWFEVKNTETYFKVVVTYKN